MTDGSTHFLAQALQQATLALRAKQFEQAKELASITGMSIICQHVL